MRSLQTYTQINRQTISTSHCSSSRAITSAVTTVTHTSWVVSVWVTVVMCVMVVIHTLTQCVCYCSHTHSQCYCSDTHSQCVCYCSGTHVDDGVTPTRPLAHCCGGIARGKRRRWGRSAGGGPQPIRSGSGGEKGAKFGTCFVRCDFGSRGDLERILEVHAAPRRQVQTQRVAPRLVAGGQELGILCFGGSAGAGGGRGCVLDPARKGEPTRVAEVAADNEVPHEEPQRRTAQDGLGDLLALGSDCACTYARTHAKVRENHTRTLHCTALQLKQKRCEKQSVKRKKEKRRGREVKSTRRERRVSEDCTEGEESE